MNKNNNKIKNKINKKQFNKFKKKENKVNNRQTRQINQLKTKLKQFSRKLNFVLPYQPRYDYSYYQKQIKAYIAALLFPENFIDCGIKLPSPIGSYSFCYGFKEAVDFTPGADGTFRLIWNPNCLGCNTAFMGTSTIEGGPKLKYTLPQGQGGTLLSVFSNPSRILWSNSSDNRRVTWHTIPSQTYTGVAEGYRLVSASIQIQYIGTNLKKSGYIISIPTYRPTPIYSQTSTDNDNFAFQDADIPELGESNFINTKGSLTSFTLKPYSKCKRVYIPCDPADLIYEDMGFYYSSAVNSSQSYKEGTADNFVADGTLVRPTNIEQTSTAYLRKLKAEDGNPLKYLFYGKGFQDDNESIHVTAYYNFELLPAEGVRMPNNDVHIKEDKISEQVKQVILEKAADLINNQINDNHSMPSMQDITKIAREVSKATQADKEMDMFVPNTKFNLNLRNFAPKLDTSTASKLVQAFDNFMKQDLRI